ncbi:chloride channel protein [Methylocapsa palsarum]|uniref:Chloride channel protein, CIC family n=1 Tax=Methylocapsa palsarum TaxID=1612308 RepID=A0A1I4CCH6_9HYPH|nr:chloride channel protein [Methylocapsa palsarum]SFK78473.1 chloride channel protein, CIC family [Methylocapsa palsarum]
MMMTRDDETANEGAASRAVHSRLRALIRRDELGVIGLAFTVGAAAGLFVAAITAAANLLHLNFFGAPHLSGLFRLETPLIALVPVLGGVLIGLSGIYVRKRRPLRPVDPIEANALRGGRMSLKDSLVITAQTITSNGFGASVGLEAAFTQLGSGFGSWLGGLFHLRRADMRTLVACGSAGAIGGAFGAPLTGAFYAFELILGAYTPFGLAPVGAAAIGGVLVCRLLGTGVEFVRPAEAASLISNLDLALLMLLGVLCAGFGIAIMRAVSLVESVFARSGVPRALQPCCGGLIVGGLALLTPQVLASGHRALFNLFSAGGPPISTIAAILLLKALASSVSIGSGFRGGLFFASLFLGGMMGKVFAAAVVSAAWLPAADVFVFTIVGMAAMGVAIVGGPLTMSFLALETTGDFPLSLVMLAVSAVVSVIVRRAFGYSFATWRLHLRGESIRSAQDVGWIRALTVAHLMRKDAGPVLATLPISEFVREHPFETAQWIALSDAAGRYAGLVFIPDALIANADPQASQNSLETLAVNRDVVLVPSMNIKDAAQIFEEAESECLVVVSDGGDRRVVGLLTESHLLRRYTEELDRAHRELSGEVWTVSP